jgi:hypothetical protein
MSNLDLNIVKSYVSENIGLFHEKRIKSLDNLKLKRVLQRKNPYLFKTKNVLNAGEIIKSIVDATISSNEETLFGDWLEGLAIFINEQVYGGRKASDPGMDLEFVRDGIRYFVAIKSGPHWSNSGQLKNLRADFARIKKTLGTSGGKAGNVVFVNGCCYGQDGSPDKIEYQKLCGQSFWELISGDQDLYLNIIEPLGQDALKRNQEFLESYEAMLNKFTLEFAKEFCHDSGAIDWEKLVKFNSQEKLAVRKGAESPKGRV